MKKILSGANQLDVDVCNTIDPPVRGCHAGAGIHVDIPADWAVRILAGQLVPGCNGYSLQITGPVGGPYQIDGLTVFDRALVQIAIPSVVNALSAPLKAAAALLVTKLANAQILARLEEL